MKKIHGKKQKSRRQKWEKHSSNWSTTMPLIISMSLKSRIIFKLVASCYPKRNVGILGVWRPGNYGDWQLLFPSLCLFPPLLSLPFLYHHSHHRSTTTAHHPVVTAKQASAPQTAFHLETYFTVPQPSQKPFEGRIITCFLTGAQRIPFAQSHPTSKQQRLNKFPHPY